MKKILAKSRNILVADFKVNQYWQFGQSFAKYSQTSDWEFHGYNNCGLIKHIFDRIKRYLLYFIIPMKYFFQYKQIEHFVAYQQFYGIILAYYLRLFKKKEIGDIVVLTFIYKQKKGLIGKVYHKFIQYSIESVYVKKLICFSKGELQYYKEIFPKIAFKFEFVRLGKNSHGLKRIDDSSEYLMAAGRSNRDYTFLIESLANTRYNLKIINDSLSDENKKMCSGRIQVYDQAYGIDYLELLRTAKVMVIPLKDAKISSGQLVTLQAMEMGVPVVVIGSDAVDDYIEHGVNGFILEKDKDDLIDTLGILFENRKIYDTIAENGIKTYWEQGSVLAMGKEIAMIVNQLNE